MMQGPTGAARVVRRKTHHEEAIARHMKKHDERKNATTHELIDRHHHLRLAVNSVDGDTQNRQDIVNQQDTNMSKDDKEKPCSVEDRSNTAVERSRKRQDSEEADDRDSQTE